VYKNMYAEIADQSENDFQELFAKEFSIAYEKQLDQLK
jgi:predicted component of type VI protein secretion system